MPMHMYPFHPLAIPPSPNLRPKRRQVKNACTKCQKACKKCDDARPCLRCVKYGIGEECVDSKRKERKKGLKRGPYKKRDAKARAATNAGEQTTTVPPAAAATVPLTPTPPNVDTFMAPYIVHNNHAIPFYPCSTPSKPIEASNYYQPYFFSPVHQPPHGLHEADATSYLSHHQHQPSLVSQFSPIYPQFIPTSRSEGQPYYAPAYPPVLYHKSAFGGHVSQGHQVGK